MIEALIYSGPFVFFAYFTGSFMKGGEIMKVLEIRRKVYIHDCACGAILELSDADFTVQDHGIYGKHKCCTQPCPVCGRDFSNYEKEGFETRFISIPYKPYNEG
jgi:hypothetical protein